MKVYIGSYRDHWISPYTIMEKVLFWKKWTDPEFDLYDDKNNKYTNWLTPFCNGLQRTRNFVRPRIEYVKIDQYDTWNMDRTLAIITLPMLKQLAASKHGAPCVDDADVPDELKSTAAPAKENEWDVDDNHFKRWDWVLSEMIQAFECKVNTEWEDQYRTGVHDISMVPVDGAGNPVARKDAAVFRMKEGPQHTYHCDYDALGKHAARNKNGYRLFGQYYEGLWD
jgi:hypothetical protein